VWLEIYLLSFFFRLPLSNKKKKQGNQKKKSGNIELEEKQSNTQL
jgi:hypothetical protein